jgi:hypothetical protein
LIHILDAEPQIQSAISILISLPWSFKLIMGFVSDLYPIYGMHRKPYLILGSLIYSVPLIVYYLLQEDRVVPLALCLFLSTIGMIIMDVMADTMVNSLLSQL